MKIESPNFMCFIYMLFLPFNQSPIRSISTVFKQAPFNCFISQSVWHSRTITAFKQALLKPFSYLSPYGTAVKSQLYKNHPLPVSYLSPYGTAARVIEAKTRAENILALKMVQKVFANSGWHTEMYLS